MRETDLNAILRDLISEEVSSTLQPYLSLLERMAAFVGAAPVAAAKPQRRGRAAAIAVAAPAEAPARGRGGRRGARRGAGRRGPGRAPRAAGGDISRFQEGQLVRYRQGRGEFEATVIGIDTDRNVLVIQRTSDDKRVERPADKVYEVA